MNCYKIEVKTTNAVGNTTCNRLTELGGEYFDCEDGILYIVTENPKAIFDKFSNDTVISITKIGIGYVL